jgi:uncharacterized phage protein (TIGR01671 family)
MAREIKFRAWDKGNKEMIYQSENTTKPNGIMEAQFTFDEMGAWIFTRNYGEQACNEVKNFELMQYTGLKDKNGKEIYEGDIVEIHDGTITAFRTSGKHIIEWWNGQFVFQANSHEEDDYINFGWWVRSNNHSASLKQIEVIGNIYENPELIEKAQA